jgi:hypothetical protein
MFLNLVFIAGVVEFVRQKIRFFVQEFSTVVLWEGIKCKLEVLCVKEDQGFITVSSHNEILNSICNLFHRLWARQSSAVPFCFSFERLN